jgi:hypothetical protein
MRGEPRTSPDLWATVVAERLGHSSETSPTLGGFVAGTSARAKPLRLEAVTRGRRCQMSRVGLVLRQATDPI